VLISIMWVCERNSCLEFLKSFESFYFVLFLIESQVWVEFSWVKLNSHNDNTITSQLFIIWFFSFSIWSAITFFILPLSTAAYLPYLRFLVPLKTLILVILLSITEPQEEQPRTQPLEHVLVRNPNFLPIRNCTQKKCQLLENVSIYNCKLMRDLNQFITTNFTLLETSSAIRIT